MTHAESRAQVAAYRAAHSYASDKQIAAALGMTEDQVYKIRKAAGIRAGRVYVRAEEVLDAVREMGTTTAPDVAEYLGIEHDAAGDGLRTLRRRGLLVSQRGKPVRWSVAA